MFKFLWCEWGHKQGVCSGCGGRSLFFHSGKEFSNVLCTFLIVGKEWVLEKVMAQGESKAVPVEGVEGRGSCHSDSFVWRSIRTCRRGH